MRALHTITLSALVVAGAVGAVIVLRSKTPPAVHVDAAVPAPAPPVAPAPTVAPVADTPAPALADPAWDKAIDLKKKEAYAEATKAFESYAKENARSPRAAEALVEAGVCSFSDGRARMKLLRNTPESLASYSSALGYFDQVIQIEPPSSFAGRAQYMRGSTQLFMGDSARAEKEYTLALDKYKTDVKYVPKSLERRAAVRRNLLRTQDAMADLQVYQSQYPKGDDAESVKRYLQYCRMFEKPAPALTPETWVQGDPATLAMWNGDLVILIFFASWCDHCEKSRPFLLDLIERYTPMGVHFVGVMDHSKGQTVESVRAWLPPKGFTLPVMMDNGQTMSAYLGSKLPDVVLIDRAGRVRWHDNPSNLQDATIETLLMEDPSASGPKNSPAPPK